MSGLIYPSAADGFAAWTTTPHVWLLMDYDVLAHRYFDPNDRYIADLSAGELSSAGYTRKSAAGLVIADYSTAWGQFRAYGATNPAWSGLAADHHICGLVLATVVGGDSTSPLIAFWDAYDPTSAADIVFTFPAWENAGEALPGGSASTGIVSLNSQERI